MTTPRSSMAVPSTQNTAPIFEFACLYTFDLRRKTKRWQDGFLRFHTFNKRVMVYDESRNFIGDTHWRQEQPLSEGDDVSLEKGVLVEVGEPQGRQEQDLAPLFAKRAQAGKVSSPVAAPESPPTVRPAREHDAAGPLTSMRPKTLNALLGLPRGAYGRAMLPKVSPFGQRQQENTGPEAATGLERPTKRRRLSTTLTPTNVTPTAAKRPPAVMKPRKDSLPAKAAPERPQALSEEFVVDSDSAEELSKGATEAIKKKKSHSVARSSTPEVIKLAKLGGQRKSRARAEAEEERPEIPRSAKRQTSDGHAAEPQALKAHSSKAQPSRNRTSNIQTSKAQSSRNGTSNIQTSNAQTSEIHPPRRQATSTGSHTTPKDDEPSARLPILTALARFEKERNRNLLRTAPSKPRKKLMHRALLPAQPVLGHHVQRNGSSKIDGIQSKRPSEDGEQSKRPSPESNVTRSRTPDGPKPREEHHILAMAHVKSQEEHSLRNHDASFEAVVVSDTSVAPAEQESLFVTQSTPPGNDEPPSELVEIDRRSLVKSFGTTRDTRMMEKPRAKAAGEDGLPLAPQARIPAKGLPARRTALDPPPNAPGPPIIPSPRKQGGLLKSLSEAKAPSPVPQPPLARALSDLTGTASGRRSAETAAAMEARRNAQSKECGPWGIEAFDLFGWRPGDEKGKPRAKGP